MTEKKVHTVRVYWENGDTVTTWNQRMAWVTEHFGLPGGVWTADVKSDWMDVHFHNEKDAIVFRLKYGASEKE